MLRILVGDVRPDDHVDFNTAAWHMLPTQLVVQFELWHDKTQDDVIRVYTDTIINWIGEQIEDKKFDRNQVEIVTDVGTHYYDTDGSN